MMDFGDKRVFVVPVVMMNFRDKGVFVRIPFHPDTLIFWAFCDRCSSFFTGNTIWAHDRKMSRLTCYMTRVRYGTRVIRQTSQKVNSTNLFHDQWNGAESKRSVSDQ